MQKYCKITLIFEEGNASQVMQVGGGGRGAVSDYGTLISSGLFDDNKLWQVFLLPITYKFQL